MIVPDTPFPKMKGISRMTSLRFFFPAATSTAASRKLATCHSMLVTLALATAVALTSTSTPASAGIPRPMILYYGQACDRYGQVYKSGADIFLLRGTQEVARTTIAGAIAPGINFRLSVPYDSDPTDATNYVPYAVDAGDILTVWATDSAGTRQVESCTVPPVGAPGEAVALRIVAGEDADADGMSDAWERANGLDPADATADLDGDGQSNLSEYRAGTLPWLASDLFGASALTPTPSGMYALTFPTTYGKLYTVQTAPLVLDETGGFTWTSCPFALEDATTPTQTRLQGTGSPVTIYLDTSALNALWRLSIQ